MPEKLPASEPGQEDTPEQIAQPDIDASARPNWKNFYPRLFSRPKIEAADNAPAVSAPIAETNPESGKGYSGEDKELIIEHSEDNEIGSSDVEPKVAAVEKPAKEGHSPELAEFEQKAAKLAESLPNHESVEGRLEKVVEAANKDIPMEIQNELRHEIKDKDDSAAHTGAAPVKTILNRMQKEATGVFAGISKKAQETPKPRLRAATFQHLPQPTYRQAAKGGLIAGIMLAILVLAALALRG